MATDNAQLATQIADKSGKLTPLAIQGQLEKWKSQHGAKLIALAGNQEGADRVYTICMNTIARNPALLECDFSTIANCILQSFQLGLYPGPFQECAYVPLNNGRTGKKEANFWPQYQGIVKLMINAGNKAVIARVVRENDYFEYKEGLQAPIYAPAVILRKQSGERLFAYAAVCTRHNLWQVAVMSPEQIAVIKSRSRGATKPDSPWNSKYQDDVDAMWAKTVLKRCAKFCTKSAELVAAVEADDKIDGDENIASKAENIIDIPSSPLVGEVSAELVEEKNLPERNVS